jgi:pimeloyl-ACP methyl ester carboxylesterase
VGDWTGTIQAGPGVAVVFHIEEATGGGLTATLDVPPQGAYGLRTGATTLAGDTLTITVPAIQGQFAGVFRGNDEIEGTWTQGPGAFPLTLERAAEGEATGPDRPQEPTGEVPYAEETVTVEAAPGVTLEGTLTVPEGEGPFPGVVLVSGSGPQDRDETILGHRPFLVWADYFARRGIAALRYDERGVGASTGTFATATTATFAADARAVVEALAGHDEIAAAGLLGHSEGGSVAPMVADSSDAVAFVVMLAGPAEPMRETLMFQLLRDLPPADTAAARPPIARALNAAAEGDSAAVAGALREAYGDAMPGEQVASFAGFLSGPWGRYALDYDPLPALRAMRVPVLALYGGRDQQVRAATNAPAALRALTQSASPHAAVEVFADKNHLFQTAPTGAPSEYAQIEETVSPEVLARVTAWIVEHTGED